jgi:hypothetical protein
MDVERRSEERVAEFRAVDLIAASGREQVFPIILRDSSGVGLGGLYVGKEPLDPDGDFLLREEGADDREVRVVWARRVAEYVQLVGLTFSGD